MVEIFFLGQFARRVGEMAQERGYNARKFHLMAVLLWCAGEALGLFSGVGVAPTGTAFSLVVIYLCALAGAGVGASMAYAIARGLRPGINQTA